MEREEFENRLRDSPYFRQSIGELFHSLEQALSLVAAATAESPDAARDHILNEVRRRLRARP